jgi:hypothetical protein
MEVSSEMMTIKRVVSKIPETVWGAAVGTPSVKVFKGDTELQWKLVD